MHKNHIQGLGGTGINHTITMHELGHAKDFNTGMTGLKKGLSLAKVPLKYGAGGVLAAAALSNKKTEDYAPAIAAVPGLITLREEGAANYHAYKGIKAHKGAKAANKFVTRILPKQMGGYILGAAVPVASAYAASKLMKVFRDE